MQEEDEQAEPEEAVRPCPLLCFTAECCAVFSLFATHAKLFDLDNAIRCNQNTLAMPYVCVKAKHHCCILEHVNRSICSGSFLELCTASLHNDMACLIYAT